MSVLAPSPAQITATNPPGKELGAETQQVGGINGWASFVDQAEFVPQLSWPSSIQTYHRMRSDSQVEALHVGTVQPVREFRWSIDPNGAPASLVEQLAADMGLPIRGHEDDKIQRGPRQFDFDAFLDDALLAPIYGHFHFEIVGETVGNEWHMLKLAPRHPRTLMEFQADTVGDLLGIRQNIGGADGWFRLPPAIPAGKLIPLVWRREAGSHVGRSQLRGIYREWLVKDRTVRVAAINLERGAGMPIIEGPQGASDSQLRDLAMLARSFKIAEGGGAVPFGSKLTLVGGNVPEAINLLKYCDDCMARVWALMLVQLGMTTTGNRALGAEFAIYAARAQRAMAKWIARGVNDFFDRYTEWNVGESAKNAPLLHFEQAKPDSMSVTDLVSLIEAGALHVDPELETWLRDENGLPPAPPAPSTPELGDLSPEEVALVTNSRNPPALPPPGSLPSPTLDQSSQSPTLAATGLDTVTLALPDRTLHRQPNEQEIRARVDFRQMDSAHGGVLAAVQALFASQIIPAQVKAIGDQITTTSTGTARTTFSKANAAAVSAPVQGADDLTGHLVTAAQSGADGALAELGAQGASATAPSADQLRSRVGDQAAAVAAMAATALTLSAQRKAAALVGGGRTPQDIRAQVEAYLNDLNHSWTMDQLNGAVTYAQNAGRVDVFSSVSTQDAMRYYASEILDVATCSPCAGVDGTEYPDIQAAEQDYAGGQYVDCEGGPRCRGVLVAVYQEVNSQTGQTDLAFADAVG